MNAGLNTVPGFPELHLVRQKFEKAQIKDINGHFAKILGESGLGSYIKQGTTVGIAVGSRGIKNIREVVATLAAFVKSSGGKPVIIPAMGSHGGANGDGQKGVLEHYGITEAAAGAEIVSCMEVIDIGPTGSGLKVHLDRMAAGCDLIVAVNRVKEHTDFYGQTESGILKMLAVGLGNDAGATYIHSMGAEGLRRGIPEIAERIIDFKKIFGIGIVENGYGETAKIEVLCGKHIKKKEEELLHYSRKLKAKIPFHKLNYLVIEEVGKNISGSGVDTKVIGRIRYMGVEEPKAPAPDIIAALRLTPESHGNAAGIGLLDLISGRLHNDIDFGTTFENGKSAKCPERYKIPMFMKDDYDTLRLGLEFAGASAKFENKVLLIKNTGSLEYMYVSEVLLKEVSGLMNNMEIVETSPVKLYFDENNDFISPFM